jgi:hypothetical protein
VRPASSAEHCCQGVILLPLLSRKCYAFQYPHHIICCCFCTGLVCTSLMCRRQIDAASLPLSSLAHYLDFVHIADPSLLHVCGVHVSGVRIGVLRCAAGTRRRSWLR